MPVILHSVLQQNTALVAATPLVFDLPVNPVSAILVTLRARDLTAVTAPRATLGAFLGLIATIQAQFKGADQWNSSFADAYVAASLLMGKLAKHNTMEFTATSVRYVTVPIMFTRRLYWTKEAFPATRRGEFRMIITPAASLAGFDTVTVQVESIELLDIQPTQYIKTTTLARTFTATGPQDVDLPLGNPILGALLFGTTFPTGGVFTNSWNQIAVLVDNVNYTYATTNWETLQGLLANRLGSAMTPWDHTHTENLAVGYLQGVGSEVPVQARDLFRQYAYMDWDPLMDESYALHTEGRGRVILRANAGVADAVRALPQELIRLAPAG